MVDHFGRLEVTNEILPAASSAPSKDHDNTDSLGTWGGRAMMVVSSIWGTAFVAPLNVSGGRSRI
jgi:hypothetical protein